MLQAHANQPQRQTRGLKRKKKRAGDSEGVRRGPSALH